jgi:hypothetical protein
MAPAAAIFTITTQQFSVVGDGRYLRSLKPEFKAFPVPARKLATRVRRN